MTLPSNEKNMLKLLSNIISEEKHVSRNQTSFMFNLGNTGASSIIYPKYKVPQNAIKWLKTNTSLFSDKYILAKKGKGVFKIRSMRYIPILSTTELELFEIVGVWEVLTINYLSDLVEHIIENSPNYRNIQVCLYDQSAPIYIPTHILGHSAYGIHPYILNVLSKSRDFALDIFKEAAQRADTTINKSTYFLRDCKVGDSMLDLKLKLSFEKLDIIGHSENRCHSWLLMPAPLDSETPLNENEDSLYYDSDSDDEFQ